VIPPDLALALLIDRTTSAYQTNVPAYIEYRETTHVSVPSLGRSQDIDRAVVARNADGEAVMQDLPAGGQRIGAAFPIIPYFDPFSQFSFEWNAPNTKSIFINLDRGAPWTLATPPPAAGNVDVVVPYFSIWSVSYAADSQPDHLHFLVEPTPRISGSATLYPSEIVEDRQTGLPSRVVIRDTSSDQVFALDYGVIDGHWVVTHGTFSATEHALFFTFVIHVDVTYSDFSFPTTPAQAALLPPPSPTPSPTP
jgi:hypothetical protein